MNIVCIVGRLTKDPEPRKTQSGNTSLSLCIAVSRGDKNKSTDFIDCQAWGKTAEFISSYFHKGDPISISGKIQTRTWQKDDGSKTKITEVWVGEATFVPGSLKTESGADEVSF